MESGDQSEKKCEKGNAILQFYHTSAHYDCTFQVSDDDYGLKLFKCHKLILAAASPAFEKLLYGSFKESSFGPDTAIPMHNVSADAFDHAMKFIYGNSDDFKLTDLAMEIYKFAHEWQIDSLMAAASNFLKDNADTSFVIQILDMYKSLGNDEEMDWCLQKIEEKTQHVLDSLTWLSCSKEAILEVLSLDNLRIGEKQLYDGLVKLVDFPGIMLRDEEEINWIIKSGLKLIRFMAMSAADFTSICEYKNQILSPEEKLQIMLSINLHDPERLPPQFSKCMVPRSLIYVGECFWWGLPIVKRESTFVSKGTTSRMTFAIMDKDRIFLRGFQLHSLCIDHDKCPKYEGDYVNFECTVFKSNTPKVILARAVFDEKGDYAFFFAESVPLEKMSFYSIEIKYFQKDMMKTVKYSPEPVVYLSIPNLTLNFPAKENFEDICALVLYQSEN